MVNNLKRTEEFSSVAEPRVLHGLDGKTRIPNPAMSPPIDDAEEVATTTERPKLSGQDTPRGPMVAPYLM